MDTVPPGSMSNIELLEDHFTGGFRLDYANRPGAFDGFAAITLAWREQV
jgi:hypothetical protein